MGHRDYKVSDMSCFQKNAANKTCLLQGCQKLSICKNLTICKYNKAEHNKIGYACIDMMK